MTTSSGVLLTDLPSGSEPESIDSLDYDDWEGQFEFIGPSSQAKQNNGDSGDAGGSISTAVDDLDDLNLGAPIYRPYTNNCRILIDEETFLSLQSNGDADSDNNTLATTRFDDGVETSTNNRQIPYFIANAQNELVPFNSNKKSNVFDKNGGCIHVMGRNSADTNNNNNSSANLNNNKQTNSQMDFDEIIKLKNQRNHCNGPKMNSDNNNSSNNDQHSLKRNGFADELCDNLNEQVRLLATTFFN